MSPPPRRSRRDGEIDHLLGGPQMCAASAGAQERRTFYRAQRGHLARMQRIEDYAARAASEEPSSHHGSARAFAFAVARTEAAAALIEPRNAQGSTRR